LIHLSLLFFLPGNLFPGYERITFITEKTLTAFGTDVEFFATHGAERFHIKFVVQGITFAALAEKPGSFRGKFLHHFCTAYTAYSSYQDSSPNIRING
jgi:hypothetical protein